MASSEKGAAAALEKPAAPTESGQTSSAIGQSGAEAVYRRALNNLQEGRSTDAIALLEQALVRDPRHEAARQTLVGLLIENKRQDEAMRQLQLGLGLEPRQLSMAMLLARMQIERGGNGIDTLTRSLPFAGGNGDYHAFLAGALQRQQRYPEAVEQYQLALRGAPQNGVWLMGLGMSLQGDHRASEAVAAFQKAKASNNLSPELSVFVERQLQQLKAE
jgi:MSHA biogenesis protein MshN